MAAIEISGRCGTDERWLIGLDLVVHCLHRARWIERRLVHGRIPSRWSRSIRTNLFEWLQARAHRRTASISSGGIWHGRLPGSSQKSWKRFLEVVGADEGVFHRTMAKGVPFVAVRFQRILQQQPAPALEHHSLLHARRRISLRRTSSTASWRCLDDVESVEQDLVHSWRAPEPAWRRVPTCPCHNQRGGL